MTPSSMPTPTFGRVMANRIADLLEKGEVIVQGQKEFYGTGLAFVDGRFVYDDLREGRLAWQRRCGLGRGSAEAAPRHGAANGKCSQR